MAEKDVELDELRQQLADARQALDAMAVGQVDAVVQAGASSPVLLRAAQDKLQADRTLLRAVLDGMLDAVVIADDQGRYCDANPAAYDLFGTDRATLLRKRVSDFGGDARAQLEQAWQEFLDEGKSSGTFILVRLDGVRREVEYNATANVLPGQHLSVLRDVTERRRLERRFQAMIEKSQDGITLIDGRGNAVYESPAVERITGYSFLDSKEMEWSEYVPEEELPRLRGAFERLTEQPLNTVQLDFRLRRRDRALRWIELAATNLLADPDVGALVTNFRDITERKELEQERDGFFMLTLDLLGIATMDGQFKRLNPAWEATLGWSLDELTGRPWIEFVHPDDREKTLREGARLAQGVSTLRFENRYRCRDGTYRWLQWNCIPRVPEGLIYASVRDVTAQRDAAERYRSLFAESPLPMWLLDPDSLQFLDVNEAAVHHFGYAREEFLSMSAERLVAPEDHREVRERVTGLLSQTKPGGWSRRLRTKAGKIRHTEVTAKPIVLGARLALLVSIQDVTERHALESQLRQVQKMDAIGQLAAGVSHDFNNLLSVILGYSDVVLRDLSAGDRLHADLLEIKNAGERAAALTRQLLAFSRRQMLQPRVLDLGSLVGDMKRMLERLLSKEIELLLPAGQAKGRIHADPSQIEQVIVNLVVNARDAMPGGGSITLETSDEELDADYCAAHTGVAPGRYVMLAVTDTGTGMDAATREKIFEPFFTTKEQGKGTGLGLSTVFGIVKQSQGHIWVYSEPGVGTTFKLYFPRAEGDVEKSAVSVPPPLSLNGDETILLVEDDEHVRTVVRSLLRRQGYRVLDAQNAGEAFLIFEQHGAQIDLLLTDLVMPRMSGTQLAERLGKLKSGLKVLYMSGYTEGAIVMHGVLESGAAFLSKPVRAEPLLQKVRALLDEPQARR